MTIQEVLQQVEERIKDFFPEEYQRAELVIKETIIDGQESYGFALMMEGREKIPLLDLETYIQEIRAGMPMDDVLKEAAEDYMDICAGRHLVRVVAISPEEVYKNLHISVINFPRNKGRLSEFPYMKINDLAVIPMLQLPNGANVQLSLKNAQSLQVPGDLLLAKAIENHSNVFPPVFLKCLDPDRDKYERVELDSPEELPKEDAVYVLANEQKMYGAAAIADKGLMDKISRKIGGNFYIIPMSVDSLAVFSEKGQLSPRDLKGMAELSAQLLEPGQFISDNVYLYHAEKHSLEMYDGKMNKENIRSHTGYNER